MVLNKKNTSKIIVIIIFLITILSNTPSIAYDNSEIKLKGSINAELNDETLGSVSPEINIDKEQTFFFNLTKNENGYYQVNKTLKIDIKINKNTDKNYLLGRYLTTFSFLIRFEDNIEIINIFEPEILNKIIKSKHRINILETNNSTIKIQLQYETKNQREKIFLIIFSIGSPGNFFANNKPFFDFKTINLDLIYEKEVKIDTSPPETSCVIEEI